MLQALPPIKGQESNRLHDRSTHITNDLLRGPNTSEPDEWKETNYRNATDNSAGSPGNSIERQAADTRVRIRDLERDRRRQTVMELWIQGYPISQIADRLNTEKHMIYEDLETSRKDLRNIWDTDLANLAAERVESLRHVVLTAYKRIKSHPGQTPQLLGSVLKAEEHIAKIQGVLTERVHVLGKIEHTYKSYDFEDNLPSMSQVVEGHIVELTEVGR